MTVVKLVPKQVKTRKEQLERFLELSQRENVSECLVSVEVDHVARKLYINRAYSAEVPSDVAQSMVQALRRVADELESIIKQTGRAAG